MTEENLGNSAQQTESKPEPVRELAKNLSIDSAADAIYAQLFGKKEAPQQVQEKVEAKPEPVKAETQEAEAKTAEVASEQSEEDTAQEPEDAGKLRHADYTKKTMELAEKRKSVEAREKEIDALKQQYASALQQAMQIAQNTDPILAEGQKTNWVKLAETDPAGYVQKRAQFEARIGQLQAMQQEQARLRDEQLNKLRLEEYKKLISVVPEWKDATVAEKELVELTGYLESAYGFTRQELEQMTDHRGYVLARKAAAYDKMMKAKTTVQNKKATPAVSRTQRPGTEETPTSGQSGDVRKLLNTAKKSQRIEDFANVIMNMRGNS